MFKTLALSLLLTFTTVCQAQNLLGFNWKFATGDNPEWAQPGFDDSTWKQIESGTPWEKQGYDAYNGFAWYRYSIVIPSKLKKEAAKFGGLVLKLGKIDDCDETWVNGQKVGSMGDLPPHFNGAYDKLREYPVSINLIKWDQPNVIAVRVWDQSGNGGMMGPVAELRILGSEDLFKLSAGLSQPDHILTGEVNQVSFRVSNDMKQGLKGTVKAKVTSDFGEKITEQSIPVSCKSKGMSTYVVKTGSLKPGFYTCTLTFEGDAGIKKSDFAFGVNPEHIVSPLNRPADFQHYWDRARHELAAVDPQFKVIPQPKYDTETKRMYLIEMRSLGNVLIRGWYSVPKKPGKYPAILQVQGYSSNQVPEYVYAGDDFVALALNIRGHGNSKDNVNPGFPGYMQYSITDKETYIYRGAYMDCVRAVDFLCSRTNEIDTSKIVVQGGSQGGALTYATAALDSRIKMAAPEIPFLSDFEDYFKVAVWPGNEFKELVQQHPEISWETVYNTLSYIDIKNLAPWIKCPVLMGIGLRDAVCPPHINMAAYNQLTVPKTYFAYPEAGHWVEQPFHTYKMEWYKKGLGLK